MRKVTRYLLRGFICLCAAILSALLIILRYILSTPQPLSDLFSGETHLFIWTHGTVRYHIIGKDDAPPIVLFHAPGIATSAYTMRAIAEGLASHYRVYVPNLPGFGQSTCSSTTYSADMYVSFYKDFLKQVISHPTTVLASGLSCNYCISVAQAMPELCERLILLSPVSVFTTKATPWYAPLLRIAPFGLFLYALFTRRPLLRYVLAAHYHCAVTNFSQDELTTYQAYAQQTGAQHAALAYLAGDLWLDVTQQRETIEQPILILWGLHPLNTALTSSGYHALPAHARVVLLQDTEHSMQADYASKVVANIRDWRSATLTPAPIAISAPAPLSEPISTPAPLSAVTASDGPSLSEATAAPAQLALEAYCVKCKQKRPMQNPQEVVTKNGRRAMEAFCPTCGTRLFRFIASSEQ